MPYISKERREAAKTNPVTAGELNYAISSLCQQYCLDQGLSYQIINDVVGAMHGALDEFNRRVTAVYEDRKIVENGDIYQPIIDKYFYEF